MDNPIEFLVNRIKLLSLQIGQCWRIAKMIWQIDRTLFHTYKLFFSIYIKNKDFYHNKNPEINILDPMEKTLISEIDALIRLLKVIFVNVNDGNI